MEPSHPSRGDPADPSSRGLRVSLLAQERALAPMAALAGLDLPLRHSSAAALLPTHSDSKEETRRRLLHALRLCHAGGCWTGDGDGGRALPAEPRPQRLVELLRETARTVCGASTVRRARELFLVATLAADAEAAHALAKAGIVGALCTALSRTGGTYALTIAEETWVMAALVELGAHDDSARHAHAMPVLAQLRASLLVTPAPEERRWGVCYAAAAVLANIAQRVLGSEALVRSGMIEPLCALLQLRRCSLSVPNLRWLFSEDPRPAAVSYVNLAGGVARALLNIAAGSTAGLIAVRASSAPSQLRLLSRHAATTPQVSHVVRAALSLLDAAVAPGAGGRPAAAAASTAVVGPPHPLVDACTDGGVTVPGCGVAGRATLAIARALPSWRAVCKRDGAAATECRGHPDNAPAAATLGKSSANPDDARIFPTAAVAGAARVGDAEHRRWAVTQAGSLVLRQRNAATGKAGGARKRRAPHSKPARDAVEPAGCKRAARSTELPGADRRRGGGGAQVRAFDKIVEQRVRAGQTREYLVKWVDPGDGDLSWEPPEHIHDPCSVAAFERGASHAALYPAWAWVLDPRGGGWACEPFDDHDEAGRDPSPPRGRGPLGSTAQCGHLPSEWPEGVGYAPFLLWESAGGQPSDGTLLRLRTSRCTPLPAVQVAHFPRASPPPSSLRALLAYARLFTFSTPRRRLLPGPAAATVASGGAPRGVPRERSAASSSAHAALRGRGGGLDGRGAACVASPGAQRARALRAVHDSVRCLAGGLHGRRETAAAEGYVALPARASGALG